MPRKIDLDTRDQIDRRVVTDYAEKGGIAIARDCGVTLSFVCKRARILGVKIEPSVNVDYFNTWTPDSAYLLGYIFSDGCLQRNHGGYQLSLGCVSQDRELIEEIKKRIRSEHKISKQEAHVDGRGKSYSDFYRIIITNTQFCLPLMERYGVLIAKSKIDFPFPSLPEGNFNHFCRGHLDGDGSVGKKRGLRVGFYGSLSFITTLRELICRELGLRQPNIYKLSSIFGLEWTSWGDFLCFYNWLYPSGGDYLFMKRKKGLFERDKLGYEERIKSGTIMVNRFRGKGISY